MKIKPQDHCMCESGVGYSMNILNYASKLHALRLRQLGSLFKCLKEQRWNKA